MQIVVTDNVTGVIMGLSVSDIAGISTGVLIAIGTIALAVMTYRTTKKVTADQKNQLITEIIDWSIRLVEITHERFIDFSEVFKQKGWKLLSVLSDQISAREASLDVMKGKYQHISETAKNLPDNLKPKDLQLAVKELLCEFDAYRNKLAEWKKSILIERLSITEGLIAKDHKPMNLAEFADDITKGIRDINKNLENAANKVIAQATKVQRRVIE